MNWWLINARWEQGDWNNAPSAERLKEEAKKAGITLSIFRPSDIEIITPHVKNSSIYVKGVSLLPPDFIITRTSAVTKYDSLASIRYLEELWIPVINSSVSIENSRDKLYSLQLLSHHWISVPKTILWKNPLNISLIEKELGFPVIIKTLHGSQGDGVYLAKNKIEIQDILQKIWEDIEFIFQKFIQTSRWRDLRVFVIGGEAIWCMERTSKNNDFKANFSLWWTIKSFPISSEIESLAINSCKILGIEIGGVDLLFGSDSYYVCEVNHTAWFKWLESSNNINVAKNIIEYIRNKAL